MNEVRWFKSLGKRPADCNGLDVAPEVMRTIRTLDTTCHEPDRLFPIAAALALLAGAAAIASVVPSWLTPQSPLASLTEAFNLVLQ